MWRNRVRCSPWRGGTMAERHSLLKFRTLFTEILHVSDAGRWTLANFGGGSGDPVQWFWLRKRFHRDRHARLHAVRLLSRSSSEERSDTCLRCHCIGSQLVIGRGAAGGSPRQAWEAARREHPTPALASALSRSTSRQQSVIADHGRTRDRARVPDRGRRVATPRGAHSSHGRAPGDPLAWQRPAQQDWC